jgi:hypothetical protein
MNASNATTVSVAHPQDDYQPHRYIEVRQGKKVFFSIGWCANEKRGSWDLIGEDHNPNNWFGGSTMSQRESELAEEIHEILKEGNCPDPKQNAKQAAQAILAVRPQTTVAYEYYGE